MTSPAPHDDPPAAVCPFRERLARYGISRQLTTDLLAEIDRLRAQIQSAHNTCARSGGCIPREEWNRG